MSTLFALVFSYVIYDCTPGDPATCVKVCERAVDIRVQPFVVRELMLTCEVRFKDGFE